MAGHKKSWIIQSPAAHNSHCLIVVRNILFALYASSPLSVLTHCVSPHNQATSSLFVSLHIAADRIAGAVIQKCVPTYKVRASLFFGRRHSMMTGICRNTVIVWRPGFNIMAQKEQVLMLPFPHNNKSLPGLPGNINIFPSADISFEKTTVAPIFSFSNI